MIGETVMSKSLVSKPESISLVGATNFINNAHGKFFSVKFIKRTTGELREMLCRTGVKKYLKNNPERPGINFKENYLIPVYDVQKKEYRAISIEGIREVKIGGVWYRVAQPQSSIHIPTAEQV